MNLSSLRSFKSNVVNEGVDRQLGARLRSVPVRVSVVGLGTAHGSSVGLWGSGRGEETGPPSLGGAPWTSSGDGREVPASLPW